jgi:soluble lytic murein transglycosylase-like protein
LRIGRRIGIPVGLLWALAAGHAHAELYAYVAADGARIYSDRPLTGGGYAPRNAAARRGVVPWHPAPRTTARHAVSATARAGVDALIERMAPEYRLDPALVKRVVEAESGYAVRAVSPKNAQGLMQLIPATQVRFGVADPYDAEQNLRGGMAYLRWLLARFRGDVRLALAGYNAGEGAVDAHGGVPPYAETRAYVARILGRYGKHTHPYVANADDAWRPPVQRAELRRSESADLRARITLWPDARVIAAGRGGASPARLIASGSGGS